MIKLKGLLWAALAVVTATGGSAFAQSPDDPSTLPPEQVAPTTTDVPPPAPVEVPPPPPPTAVEPYTYEATPTAQTDMSRVGFSLSAGGGVADFTSQDMRDTTAMGGTWAVRAVIGTKTPLGFEGSYIGSAQDVSALGLDNGAMLVSNGVQGALRLNAVTNAPITPFIFGGVAWSRFSITNTDRNTSALSDNDDLLEVPVGLGVGGSYRGFGYDVRGELRFATNEDLLPEFTAGRDTGTHADMHRWGVNATIGYGF